MLKVNFTSIYYLCCVHLLYQEGVFLNFYELLTFLKSFSGLLLHMCLLIRKKNCDQHYTLHYWGLPRNQYIIVLYIVPHLIFITALIIVINKWGKWGREKLTTLFDIT
jgi:hypothetical protein